MLNGKKVVGIVPYALNYGKTEDRYADKYFFTDTYCVRAKASGLIPVGILPVDCRLETEAADLCDAFIVQGGKAMNPFHIELVEYAIKTGKKLLGICLGCQSVQTYFGAKEEAQKCGFTGEVGEFYRQNSAGRVYRFLKRVEGHYPSEILPRGDLSSVKHPVHLAPDSQLAKILGKTEIMGASFHIYCIGEPAPGITVTGWADDGTIEAIEYGDKIIGTQFHPDVDGELQQIFDWLKD